MDTTLGQALNAIAPFFVCCGLFLAIMLGQERRDRKRKP